MSSSIVNGARTRLTVPIFLAPAFVDHAAAATTVIAKVRPFSSSTCYEVAEHAKRRIKKQRGVSALRSTGPRTRLSLSPFLELPKVAEDYEARRAEFDQVDDAHGLSDDHGLWQFFTSDKRALVTPMEESSHGRSWTKLELQRKSFDDLWRLYWACVKEANQVVTRQNERTRAQAGYGGTESGARLDTIQTTQRRIRRVLLERHEQHLATSAFVQTRDLIDIFPEIENKFDLVPKQKKQVLVDATETEELVGSADQQAETETSTMTNSHTDSSGLEDPRSSKKKSTE